MTVSNLPNVLYNLNPGFADTKFFAVKNFWRRAQILDEYKGQIALFDEYIVNNGESPETIAQQIYSNPFYNWTILVANDIVNYHDQWPRSNIALNEYVYSKYENPSAIKQHETTEVADESGKIILKAGLVVPSTYTLTYSDAAGFPVTVAPVTPISFYEYEDRLNQEKEKIQIIKPELIDDFVDAYQKVLLRAGDLSVGLSFSDVRL
jgi:hypothetical protein